MQSPYQRICICGSVLFAACGSVIDSFDLEDGLQLSSYDISEEKSKAFDENIVATLETPSLTPHRSEASSVDIVLESESSVKQRRVSKTNVSYNNTETVRRDQIPNGRQILDREKQKELFIISMLATHDGSHLIVVTEDDKAVTVFRHNDRGYLMMHSER